MHQTMQIKASLNKVWILFHQFFSCERTIEQLRLLKSITFTLLNYFIQHTGGEVIEEMKLLKWKRKYLYVYPYRTLIKGIKHTQNIFCIDKVFLQNVWKPYRENFKLDGELGLFNSEVLIHYIYKSFLESYLSYPDQYFFLRFVVVLVCPFLFLTTFIQSLILTVLAKILQTYSKVTYAENAVDRYSTESMFWKTFQENSVDFLDRLSP